MCQGQPSQELVPSCRALDLVRRPGPRPLAVYQNETISIPFQMPGARDSPGPCGESWEYWQFDSVLDHELKMALRYVPYSHLSGLQLLQIPWLRFHGSHLLCPHHHLSTQLVQALSADGMVTQ